MNQNVAYVPKNIKQLFREISPLCTQTSLMYQKIIPNILYVP